MTWRVELDYRGEPVSVVAYQVKLQEYANRAYDPETGHWIFLVDGDDVTSRTAMDIAQNRRRLAVVERERREERRLNFIVRSTCIMMGWIGGVFLGPTLSDLQNAVILAGIFGCATLPLLWPRR